MLLSVQYVLWSMPTQPGTDAELDGWTVQGLVDIHVHLNEPGRCV